MKSTQFWKNFSLMEELGISGNFIYDGMRCFHEMTIFDFVDEIFMFLYKLSVGLERLLKIAVILLEHDDVTDQTKFEKSLITHNHLELLNRIKKHVPTNLSSPQHELLSLLGTFYKSFRYDRFTVSSAYNHAVEVKLFTDFLGKYLHINSSSLFGTKNEDKHRKFIRKHILKISTTIYEIIQTKAMELQFTYELRHGSKAEAIFLRKIDLFDEDVLWKELLIFFMNTDSKSKYLDFLRSITPLNFDPNLVDDYLDCFQSNTAKAFVIDELEEFYSELESKSERLELIKRIAAPSTNVLFDSLDDE